MAFGLMAGVILMGLGMLSARPDTGSVRYTGKRDE